MGRDAMRFREDLESGRVDFGLCPLIGNTSPREEGGRLVRSDAHA
jgi:hypothetical protein